MCNVQPCRAPSRIRYPNSLPNFYAPKICRNIGISFFLSYFEKITFVFTFEQLWFNLNCLLHAFSVELLTVILSRLWLWLHTWLKRASSRILASFLMSYDTVFNPDISLNFLWFFLKNWESVCDRSQTQVVSKELVSLPASWRRFGERVTKVKWFQ